METEKRQFQGISGNALKMIAVITMLIDHIGASFIEGSLLGYPDTDAVSAALAQDWGAFWLKIDMVLRIIGRIAFPIFCFLLVEGFFHTGNVKRYAKRLFLFALISEVPFDLAVFGTPFYTGYQNVYFTLVLALGAMYGYEHFRSNGIKQAFCVGGACLAAELFRTDYGMMGIVMVMILHVFRNNKTHQTLWGAAVAFAESLRQFGAAALAFIPIRLYNGQRGKSRLQYFFYWFYPVHLLILGLVRLCMDRF